MKRVLMVFGWLMLLGCTGVLPPNIPNVPVDQTIFIFDAQYAALQGVGGYAELPGGSRGILVFRVSIDRFNAYEMHCPYESSGTCGRVRPDDTGLFLVDDDCGGDGCGSRFNIIDGSVVSGPSFYPLVQYQVVLSGQGILRVFN
jgi:hypothetical protein